MTRFSAACLHDRHLYGYCLCYFPHLDHGKGSSCQTASGVISVPYRRRHSRFKRISHPQSYADRSPRHRISLPLLTLIHLQGTSRIAAKPERAREIEPYERGFSLLPGTMHGVLNPVRASAGAHFVLANWLTRLAIFSAWGSESG
jgi:hypothetical protein